ncbi:GNAT family N-acetyltransferase [Halorussus litoreus]|uniref:GNAT family N-acetyltransferase n=1 Tax=Halorussus litoreus TaxID=1710536 RepID=UPI0034A3C79D
MTRDREAAGVTVCEATPDDRLDVRRVLDAAMLDVREDLRERLAAGDVLTANGETGSVLGALVLVPRDRDCDSDDDRDRNSNDGDRNSTDGDRNRDHDRDGVDVRADAHVDAIAVRHARRGRGIGSALVRTAAERHDRLTAEFDPGVRPFYESLGFEIEAVEGRNDRLRGCYRSHSA